MQGVAQHDGGVAGDLPLLTVLVKGLQELRVLLDALRVMAWRAEQELLEVVVQVLACLRGDLPVGDPRLQFPHERGRRRGDVGQGAGAPRRRALSRLVRLVRSRMSRGWVMSNGGWRDGRCCTRSAAASTISARVGRRSPPRLSPDAKPSSRAVGSTAVAPGLNAASRPARAAAAPGGRAAGSLASSR